MTSRRTFRVNMVLATLGAIGGAVAAIPITVLGKLITDAPPASMPNYLWNMGALAAMAAIGSPFLTWSALRRVPLWRAIAEPAAGAVVGGAVALAVGSPIALLLLMPVGIGAATWRLHRAYRVQIDRTLEPAREHDTPLLPDEA